MLPGEMAPPYALKPHQGYHRSMAGTFPYSSGVRTLVSAFFWETNSILVR